MRIPGMQIVIESVSYLVFMWEKMLDVDGFSTDYTVYQQVWNQVTGLQGVKEYGFGVKIRFWGNVCLKSVLLSCYFYT